MKKTVVKEFLGHDFSYLTEVDDKTGQALWNKEIDNQFSKWIYQLREENRELFKIQYSISSNALAVLDKLKEKIGVYDESLIVRAITITFINFLDTRSGKGIIKKLNLYKDSPDKELLTSGDMVKKNLYFSPVGIRDVESYSKLTGLKKSAVLQNALYSILLISINEDEEIKKFWEQEILGTLTTIAKAA